MVVKGVLQQDPAQDKEGLDVELDPVSKAEPESRVRRANCTAAGGSSR